MNDIVERLRIWPLRRGYSEMSIRRTMRDAADEIEKLRTALQWLVNDLQDYPASARPIAAYDNALEVLGEKE